MKKYRIKKVEKQNGEIIFSIQEYDLDKTFHHPLSMLALVIVTVFTLGWFSYLVKNNIGWHDSGHHFDSKEKSKSMIDKLIKKELDDKKEKEGLRVKNVSYIKY